MIRSDLTIFYTKLYYIIIYRFLKKVDTTKLIII